VLLSQHLIKKGRRNSKMIQPVLSRKQNSNNASMLGGTLCNYAVQYAL